VQIEWLQMTSVIATDVFKLFLYKRYGDIKIRRIESSLLESSSGGIMTSFLCRLCRNTKYNWLIKMLFMVDEMY
jgi:hypothetical protein